MPAKEDKEDKTKRTITLSALQPKQSIPKDKYQRIAAVQNSNIGQWEHALTKSRLNNLSIIEQTQKSSLGSAMLSGITRE
jgi:hypothetical protein